MTEFHMSQSELAALRTKKIHEKVIGAKFNSNDEINHIAQQMALTNMGMSIVSKITGGKSGKK
jgi:hypothetical protein